MNPGANGSLYTRPNGDVRLIRFNNLSWTAVTVRRTRHVRLCLLCDRRIVPGCEAFRPITHGKQRMKRICRACGTKVGHTDVSPRR